MFSCAVLCSICRQRVITQTFTMDTFQERRVINRYRLSEATHNSENDDGINVVGKWRIVGIVFQCYTCFVQLIHCVTGSAILIYYTLNKFDPSLCIQTARGLNLAWYVSWQLNGPHCWNNDQSLFQHSGPLQYLVAINRCFLRTSHYMNRLKLSKQPNGLQQWRDVG